MTSAQANVIIHEANVGLVNIYLFFYSLRGYWLMCTTYTCTFPISKRPFPPMRLIVPPNGACILDQQPLASVFFAWENSEHVLKWSILGLNFGAKSFIRSLGQDWGHKFNFAPAHFAIRELRVQQPTSVGWCLLLSSVPSIRRLRVPIVMPDANSVRRTLQAYAPKCPAFLSLTMQS